MAREPKPWQRGYIPTVGKRAGAGWTAPEAPPGWYRTARRDLVEYQYGDPVTSEFYTPDFARVCIIGGVALPWRLYRGYDPLGGVFTGPVFESSSLDTVAMWWSIEQSNQPEPEPESGFNPGAARQYGKLRTLGMAYGAGAQQLAAYKQLLDVDMAKIERRVAADIYADFAKNFKGSKP